MWTAWLTALCALHLRFIACACFCAHKCIHIYMDAWACLASASHTHAGAAEGCLAGLHARNTSSTVCMLLLPVQASSPSSSACVLPILYKVPGAHHPRKKDCLAWWVHTWQLAHAQAPGHAWRRPSNWALISERGNRIDPLPHSILVTKHVHFVSHIPSAQPHLQFLLTSISTVTGAQGTQIGVTSTQARPFKRCWHTGACPRCCWEACALAIIAHANFNLVDEEV